MKDFPDDKINVTQTLDIGLRRIESIVGKAENGGYTTIIFMPPYRKIGGGGHIVLRQSIRLSVLFFMLLYWKIGGILFYCCTSVRPSVFLYKLNIKTYYFPITP